MLAVLYRRFYDEDMVSDGTTFQHVCDSFNAMDGLVISIPLDSFVEPSTIEEAHEYFLECNGPDYDLKCQSLQKRLSQLELAILPIPRPLFLYSLAMLGCMRYDKLSDTHFEDQASLIMKERSPSLPYVTGSGVRFLERKDTCNAVKIWLHDICRFAFGLGHLENTLIMAAKCFTAYWSKRLEQGTVNGNYDHPYGLIAKKMLKDDVHSSRLLLGIRSSELKALFLYLPFIMEGAVDNDMMEYLKRTLDKLFAEL
ncbi:hypothetical protein IWW57_002466 [Coemansia sp. S610]|nr:hypothetical protein IWW57_002466 [Coemansia sp. S610]